MSCNKPFFVRQEQDCKETYLSNLPDNIDYLIYRGGYDSITYNEETHLLELMSKDDLQNTFGKTYDMFTYFLREKRFDDYEYILRTNTSTYINVELLNAFVQQLDNDNEVWGSELVYDAKSQNVECIYLRGNALLLNRKHIKTICKNGGICRYLNNKLIDDETIGAILYVSSIMENEPIIFKSYTECWYKSVLEPYSAHQISNMNNTCLDFELLQNVIAIQIKTYMDRALESYHYAKVHKVFLENKYDDINKSIEFINDYSIHPDIFLGEIYGYRKTELTDNGYTVLI